MLRFVRGWRSGNGVGRRQGSPPPNRLTRLPDSLCGLDLGCYPELTIRPDVGQASSLACMSRCK